MNRPIQTCTTTPCTPANGVPAPAPAQRWQHPLERMMDEVFGASPLGRADFAPPLDIAENDQALVVRVDVPGMEPKDLQVNFERNVLSIAGERKSEERTETDRYHRVERRSGRFVRQVEFHTPVDGDGIAAEFRNGVLTVTLPKHERARPRTIDVKARD